MSQHTLRLSPYWRNKIYHFMKEGDSDLIMEVLSACVAMEGAFKNIKKALPELKIMARCR